MDNTEISIEKTIFSLNKKAKNLRDLEHELLVQLRSLPKDDKVNRQIFLMSLNKIKEKKSAFYKKKDVLLDTYFEPSSIHRVARYKTVVEIETNIKNLDVNKLFEINHNKSLTNIFLKEKYQKRIKEVTINGCKYRLKCFCFNNLLPKDIIELICIDIKNMNYPNIIVKGTKIYVPSFMKMYFDDIFEKYLWNGDALNNDSNSKTLIRLGKLEVRKVFKNVLDRYEFYLFYKTSCFAFHYPIKSCTEYSGLPIIDINLDTMGMDEQHLIEDKLLDEICSVLLD